MPGSTSNKVIDKDSALILKLGEVEYNRVLALQRHLNSLNNDNCIGDVLMFLQHSDVYTMGIHRNPSEIVMPGIEVVEVERGGSATYHGPGQAVVYFMVNLKNHGINIRDLIVKVEEALVRILEDYEIKAEGRLHGETGVWTGNRKICSVGFALKGFSTLHGIALNVSTDLSKFDAIMPCGMQSAVMTSMERETGMQLDINEVFGRLRLELLAALGIKNIVEAGSLRELAEYSVGDGLRLLPEELLKVVV